MPRRTVGRARCSVRPLLAMLSQQSTVSPPTPAARRCIEPAPSQPRVERGRSRRRDPPDIGMGEVELAGRRIVAVALLGDRQGDDPRRRGRDPGEQGSSLLGRQQRLADDADHARPLVRPVVLDQRVEAVLRPERVAHGRAAQARPADRPGSRRHGERALGEDRLVRAVEGAEAEVDDADVGIERGRPAAEPRGETSRRVWRERRSILLASVLILIVGGALPC